MKPTEIQPVNTGAGPGRLASDRLTQVLIWTAFFLFAAVVALAVDLWLRPTSDGGGGQVVQAAEPSPLPPTPTLAPALAPTLPPTPEPPTPSPTPVAEAATPTAVTPEACVPPNDWGIHIVQQGNTLYSLAQRYGTDVDTLMYVNCLNTHTIFIGQRLYVPGPVATPTVPTPVPTQTPAPIYASTPRPGASVTPSYDLSAETTPLATNTPIPTSTPKANFQVNIPDHYLNIVLLGSDRRPNTGHWRTDSMIIVSVDRENNVVRLLSLPRDLWVYIPGHGYNRINTADLWGELAQKGTGPDRVKQTIHYNLGIPIHYYVRVDFQGFMRIIDAVGGIDVDVECPLSDINLTAGMHHMNGQEALRYARSRKSTSTFDREYRQRKVLMALWDQALTLNIIPKLPELWRSMADTFQTDLPLDQVINLAYLGTQLKPQYIRSSAISSSMTQSWMTPQGAAVQLPREDAIRAHLESFYAPVPAPRLDTVDKVHVRVLNGSTRNQAEALATSVLNRDGFKIVGAGPAGRQDYTQTQILVFTGNVPAAEKLAQSLRLSAAGIQNLTAAGEQPDPDNPVDIQVILGSDYNPCKRY